VTSYAYDGIHRISPSDYYLPSDPITWTSFTWNRVRPLLQPGVKNLASLGINVSCPICAIVLSTASNIDGLWWIRLFRVGSGSI
jgi:hypothetical protein